MVFDDMKLFG